MRAPIICRFGRPIASLAAVAILLAGVSVFAAQNTYIDATFSAQDGTPLGAISNDPSMPATGAIEYCPDNLPLEVMIHAQTTSGTGAEYATVQLLVDSAVAVTDSLDMAGVVYVNVDVPHVSDTVGDTHTLQVRLIADANFSATQTSGTAKVVACEGGGGLIKEFGPFRYKRPPIWYSPDDYVMVPLKEAIDTIWLTRDRIDEMHRNAQLEAEVNILLPAALARAIEEVINEDPALLEQLEQLQH